MQTNMSVHTRGLAQRYQVFVVPLVHAVPYTYKEMRENLIFSRSSCLSLSPPLSRPPSPMLDSVHHKHCNSDQLAEDFQVAFRGCELADVAFIVGDSHIPHYAVKAILACRSRSVQLWLLVTHTSQYTSVHKYCV